MGDSRYKRVAEDLRDRERQLSLVTDALPALISYLDKDERYYFVNRRYEEFYGVPRDQIIGEHVRNILGDENYKKVLPYIQAALSGKRFNTEVGLDLAHTGVRYFEISYIPDIKDDGDVTGFYVFALDITERKEARDHLRKEKDYTRNILNTAQAIILELDKEGRIVNFNPYMEEISGYRIGEVWGKDWFDTFLPEKERENTRTIFLEAIDDIKTRGNITAIVTKNGEERDIEWYDSTIKDAGGITIGLLAVGHDVTERRLAEVKLRESEERFKGIVNRSFDGITTTDMEGRVTYVSPSVERITGYGFNELLGQQSGIFVAESSRIEAVEAFSSIFSGNEVSGIMLEIVRKDGLPAFIEISGSPILLDGKVNGIQAVFRDITERRQMEEERRKTDRLDSVGTLAGGIAHDFNNLLTGILGNISLARTYIDPEGEGAGKLKEAENTLARARDLTRQLLTFSKGGAPVKGFISPAKLIRESAEFMLHGSNVRPVFSFPDDMRSIEADEGQISQVINNLVKNANEAMPEGGIIEISARNISIGPDSVLPLKEGEYIEIAVKDQGTGISAGDIKKIFDPYYTTKQTGTGLGLASCYSIIRNHGGHIDVSSEPGAGSTFRVFLPATEEQVPVKEVKESQPALAGQGRILVMDDEMVLRKILSEALTRFGYEVEVTCDGAEAIERYKEARESDNPFDAVIMDLTVPGGMGGKEAIRKLLEIDPGVKAIVSSGYANDSIMAEYREYGFSAVVEKPYNVNEIVNTLNSLLEDKSRG